MNEKNVKINKRSHYRGYASTYTVETLNYFNLELQLEEAESVIRNKLIDLLSELKDVTALVLEFNKKRN